MGKRLLLFLCILMLVTTITRSEPYVNRLSLLGVGAKAIALNGAFTAIADDYSATFWNPAGIGFVNSINLGGMHSQMSLNRTLDFVSLIVPIFYKDCIGISWAGFKIDEIEARSENSIQPDHLFNSTDRMIWATYSRKLIKQLSIGVNFKFLQSRLSNSQAIGAGFDVGIMVKLFENFRLSFVSQDIRSQVKWETGKTEIFKRVDRLGFFMKPTNTIQLSTDLVKINDKTSWALGTEIELLSILRIRSGLRKNIWALGTGLSVPFKNNNFVLINYTITTDSFNNGIFHIFDFNVLLF